MHATGFGSFKQLLVICALQNIVAQAFAISGIVLAIVTGVSNILARRSTPSPAIVTAIND
jgi:hypothetical protein